MARPGRKLHEFDVELKVASKDLEPDAIARELALTAIETRDRAIAEGEASPDYETFVNGKTGVDEFAVVPPGPIIYLFKYGAEVAQFALDAARAASPVSSGRYRDAWFILADGAQVAPEELREGQPYFITNDVPYARKIGVGSVHLSVPEHVVSNAVKAIRRRFGTDIVRVSIRFVDLAGAYVMKTTRYYPRSHRTVHAGERETYPSILVRPR